MLIRGAPGVGPATPELHRRLRWLVVVVVFAFGALVARLWQLQVVRGDEYLEEALSNVVKKHYIPSVRGKIVDRLGRPLATNRPAYNIYVKPRFFDAVLPELVRMLGLNEDEQALMRERIEVARKRRARTPQLVLADQGSDRATLVEQASFRLEGVDVRYESARYYPYGELAAHVVGYMNKMTPAELEVYREQGYSESELIGRDGLESKLENHLRGKKGEETFVVNAHGQRVEGGSADALIEGQRLKKPVAGHDVVLTLDIELQKVVEQAVRRHTAAAVAVVDVHTGRLLALLSKPSFDSNEMTGSLTRARKAELDADPGKPFLDKTVQQHYPPGSLYKFVTGIAALEEGEVLDEELLYCPGYHERSKQRFHCTSKHGKVDFLHAIQHSCNVYFWQLAERVGIDRMAEVARDFGFGEPTGLGLNGDVPGRVPTKDWYRERAEFRVGYTLNAATGQGDVEVTVLQLAMAYAAMANGGELYVPQVVSRVVNAAGETMFSYEPKLRRKVQVSADTLTLLREGMRMVVNEEGGTAFKYAKSDVIELAGKTGTAQVRGRRRTRRAPVIKGWHPYHDHAWFAGYAPMADPEIAIVVLIEHGGPGGKVAGPVARRILEGYFTKVKPAYERAQADKRLGAATP